MPILIGSINALAIYMPNRVGIEHAIARSMPM